MQPTIQKTNDYKKLSLHKKNRIINWPKVNKLAEAMKKNSLLPIYPIIVNPKFEILDGQHRFEAAKIARVDIYYIVSSGCYDIENVAESNCFQKGWNIGDFIRYHTKDGKPEFVKLTVLADKYKIWPAQIANLHETEKNASKIKDGTFTFSNYEETVEVLKHARTIGLEFGFDHWNKRPFLRAIKYILTIKGYNKLRMGQKIQAHRSKLVKCHEAKQYISLLEEIYNTRSIEQLRFS